MVVRDDCLDAAMCDNCTAEGPAFNDKARAAAAWNRRAAPVSAPIADELASCSPQEVAAFEKWAADNRYDMQTHPLHWLFLNERTNAARQGWKAALEFARAALANQPASTKNMVYGQFSDADKTTLAFMGISVANQPAPTVHPSGRPYLTNAEAAQWARDNGLAYPPEWDQPAPTAAPEQDNG
jgi:hypothetical protein